MPLPASAPSASPRTTLPSTPPTAATPPPRKRGTVACRRCRRLRAKCLHSGNPPCEGCKGIGGNTERECEFPRRGDKAGDRLFRRREAACSRVPSRGNTVAPSVTTTTAIPVQLPLPGSTTATSASVLPPLPLVLAGTRKFISSYFQLGFLPSSLFLERLQSSQHSISPFLLCSILAISARFTPELVVRYGSPQAATGYFLEAAGAMVVHEMYQPSLEGIQGFFLLAIGRWGEGDRERSSMDMGISVRMAGLLKMHCEESYTVNSSASGPSDITEAVIRSESARRTFWMIQSQENLHSGYKTPTPFPTGDITTLLPCDEDDFAFGRIPTRRAAVEGTLAALVNPDLVHDPNRCLFASLLQIHHLWGQIARRACRSDAQVNSVSPWKVESSYQVMKTKLEKWEESLPESHRFSVWRLRGWRAKGLHLAFLAVTMIVRLGAIVNGRIYLEDMIAALSSDTSTADPKSAVPTSGPTSPSGLSGQPPPNFWLQMATDLFTNVHALHQQITAYSHQRPPDEGFPQILVFCVYVCGSLAETLWRVPTLCPEVAGKAEEMAMKSLEVLTTLGGAWKGTRGWRGGGTRGGMGDEEVEEGEAEEEGARFGKGMVERGRGEERGDGMESFPNEIFDAEMAAFFQGGLQFKGLGGWDGDEDGEERPEGRSETGSRTVMSA